MRYIDLVRYIYEKEQTTKYKNQHEDYINFCELRCGGLSIKEVYQDAKLSERRM